MAGTVWVSVRCIFYVEWRNSVVQLVYDSSLSEEVGGSADSVGMITQRPAELCGYDSQQNCHSYQKVAECCLTEVLIPGNTRTTKSLAQGCDTLRLLVFPQICKLYLFASQVCLSILSHDLKVGSTFPRMSATACCSS